MARRQLQRVCIVLLVAAAMLSSLLTISSQPAEAQSGSCSTSFIDVPQGQYYSEAVTWAACTGITSGTSATTFSPNAPVSRAQMATFLWRYAGNPTGGSHPFVDVPAGSYYDQPAGWLAHSGISTGTSATTFSPFSNVTRAQIATFLWRYAGEPTPTSSVSFSDVPAGKYYTDAVAWMKESGIAKGTSTTTFGPGQTLNRADMVTFLWRMSDHHDQARQLAVDQILDALDSHEHATGSYVFNEAVGIDHGQGWLQYTNNGAYSTSIANTLVGNGHLTPDYLTDPLDTNKDHYFRLGRDFLIFRCAGAVGVFVKTDIAKPSPPAQAFWTDNGCNNYALENGFNYFRVAFDEDGANATWSEIEHGVTVHYKLENGGLTFYSGPTVTYDSDGNPVYFASQGGGHGFSRRI